MLSQLEKIGVSPLEIHDIFVTHTHADHILGVIWIIRIYTNAINYGYEGEIHVYGHDKVISTIQTLCQLMLRPKDQKHLGRYIFFHEVKDRETQTIAGYPMRFFDIFSTKEKQFGFQLRLPSGQRLTCLGDEPYKEANREYAEGVDWLMCEAFCLYADREQFHPYEKSHSTTKEVGELAQSLGVGHLVLYHTEDKTLSTRKESYTREVSENYHGDILVPDDLETIILE